MWLATAAAALSAAGSVVGLAFGTAIYGRETTDLSDTAAAQDLVNVFLVAPLTVIFGYRARNGHLTAYLLWGGCLAFTVYNYAIHAAAIQFGPLFLLWIGVLGGSVFALLGSVVSTDLSTMASRFAGRPARWPAWFLIVSAGAFAGLWLREIVPDLLAGARSTSAARWNVPTNPVHVLDLAFFLPAAVVSGILLLRRHRWGYATAPPLLTWMALTCLPILVTLVVAAARGHDAAWAVTGPIGLMLLTSVAALALLIRAATRPEQHHQSHIDGLAPDGRRAQP